MSNERDIVDRLNLLALSMLPLGKGLETDMLATAAATIETLRAEVKVRDLRLLACRQKCEQYWNGPAPEAPEFRAILGHIHANARGEFDTTLLATDAAGALGKGEDHADRE